MKKSKSKTESKSKQEYSLKRTMVNGLIRLRFVALAIWLVATLFPIFWLALTSFKARPDIFTAEPRFFFTPTLMNYQFGADIIDPFSGDALFYGVSSQFPAKFVNSIIISLGSTVLALLIGVMLAYALSKLKVPGGITLLTLLLSLYLVTPILFTPALFEIFKATGLYDTHIGLAMVYATFALPLTVWILKSFFDTVPRETIDAAKVDGASTPEILFRITLPQIRVGLAVASIFAFLVAWNDFIFTLTLTQTNASTFIFLADFLDDILRAGILSAGPLASMTIVHLIPALVFAFLVQRYLLLGFSAGTIRREVE